MASEKLVRCEVRKKGSSRSVRYVPSEVFELWQYLMTEKHGFDIESPVSSLWMDNDEAEGVISSEEKVDEVDEVILLVFEEERGMFKRICRYFLSSEAEQLKENLVSHFSKGKDVNLTVATKKGVWVRRLLERSDSPESVGREEVLPFRS
ncbi:MAG: hypothetical protein QME66_06140 [Candidatus Eisenbacteria bacterium]|nr:hypothetical protein [Candidatus Eisenbacteria bacterium]